jgi:hypothetical protein
MQAGVRRKEKSPSRLRERGRKISIPAPAPKGLKGIPSVQV